MVIIERDNYICIMKRIFILFLAMSCMMSCFNEKMDYKDFDTKSIYFPYQYPVRTLSLGNDQINNDLDKQHKFHIGVCVGGYYDRNDDNWSVDFIVDNTLVPDNLYNNAGGQLKVLPSEYYTLSPASSVVIPEGSFSGLIEVQLTDSFFDDPEAIKGTYVIPLKITGVQSPAVALTGKEKEGVTAANPHVSEDWEVLPMDYTLFGVKYVNKYHGTWLRRGLLTARNSKGEIVDQVRYHADYVEFDELVNLRTTGLHSFIVPMNVKSESWVLDVTTDEDEALTVSSTTDSKIKILSGTGRYRENGDAWGGTPEKMTPRDAIYLNYFFKRADGTNCEVSDTLVFRDRGIVVETARPVVK